MTRRKQADAPYSRLQLAQYRLRNIAMHLEYGNPLPEDDKNFLISALNKAGRGSDANAAFAVKAKRGERKVPANTIKTQKIRFALSFIATLNAPETDGGFGMDLLDAIAEAARKFKDEANFKYTEETLEHYWNHYPEWRTRQFPRPIETLPDRRDFEPKS